MNDVVPRKRGRRPDKALAALRGALLELLKDHPFHELTTRDIIQQAAISPATFYRHYSTKEALLDAVADGEIEMLLKISSASFTSPRESSLAQIQYLDAHRALWSVLLSGGAAGHVREGLLRRLSQEYADERWRSETWIPNELAIRFAVAGTIEIITWWLEQADPPPLETLAEMLYLLTARPSLTENGPTGGPRP